MYLACQGRDGIDVKAYEAFHTTLDAEAVYDVIEMQQVTSTWMDAARENARLEQKVEEATRKAAGGRR